MKPFRFRATAALDLRRQQEQEAAHALARVEGQFREAQEACAVVERERVKAQQEQLARSEHGIDMAALFWHRNWISRLDAMVGDLRVEVQKRTDLVKQVEQLWRLAKRRRLALDRARDRALGRYRAEEQRQELKGIDELARLRFTMPDPGEETTGGD